MLPSKISGLAAGVITALTACVLPYPSLSQDGSAERLDQIAALDRRVADVAYRLATSNVDLCSDTKNIAGWTLHSASQYSASLRPQVEDHFNLRGDLPGVIAVAAGGPAMVGGFLEGDLLVAVNDVPLQPGANETSAATFEGLQANIDIIRSAFLADQVSVDLIRNSSPLRLTLTPIKACGYDVQLDTSDALEARASGQRIHITTALAAFADMDDELAIILGHEMAHIVLSHRKRFSSRLSGPLGALAVSPFALAKAERDADRTGLYLMARAGYRPHTGPEFWRRFGSANWRARQLQWGNYPAERRARELDNVAAEITTRLADGATLIP